MEGAVGFALIALILAVHIYAIFHPLQHGQGGMALLLFLFPGLARFWLPLHHHDQTADRPAT